MTIEQRNSNELKQKFHDRAWFIANNLSKQLLTLSTGIIGAFFILVFNRQINLRTTEKLLILISITLFGLSILSVILGMQWDASKNYFLGQINDPAKLEKRAANELEKAKYDKKQQKAKLSSRIFFILGTLSAIALLAINIF